jgi:cytochrome c oxidase subunit 4
MSDHNHGDGHEHGGDHEHHSHGGLYLIVFGVLCGCTLISIVADVFGGGESGHSGPKSPILVGIVLAVAVCKALCVMMYFMHLKFERAWKYLLLAPTFILAATIPFALTPDIGTHYYTPTNPQIYEHEALEAAGKSHGHRGDHDGEHAPETKPQH